MPHVELACVLLLTLGVALRARAPHFGEWLRDAPVVFVAAWVGENSTIRAFDFYRYNPAWHAFVDVTPLIIPAIWVFVVLSARDIARIVAPKQVVAGAYALIFLDASFVEPICTFAGLWKWSEPGPFAVPFIGTLGWTFFGGSLVLCLERLRWRWLAVLLAPLMMHALLTVSWWAAFKWLGGAGSSDVGFTVACWLGCLGTAAALIRARRAASVDLSFILPRLGPAAFFFTLLSAFDAPLILWLFAAAFVVPWVTLTRWRAPPGARRPARALRPS